MKEDKEFVEIIRKVQSMGTKKALDVLKNVQVEQEEIGIANIITFIINEVIKESDNKYKRDDFFQKNIRGEIVLARNIIVVAANKLTFLKPKDLYKYISISGRSTSDCIRTIRRTLREYRDLSIGNKFDKKIIDKTEKVMEAVVSGMKIKKTIKNK